MTEQTAQQEGTPRRDAVRKKWLVTLVCVASVFLVLVAVVAAVLFSYAYKGSEDVYVYVRPGDDVRQKLDEAGVRTLGFNQLSLLGFTSRTGRYVVHPGDNIFCIFKRFRNGEQEPIQLTLPSFRLVSDLPGYLGKHLMMDSTEVARALSDSVYIAQYGYTPETLPALFIPNTYEMYWNTSLDGFMQRMQTENANFWTPAREKKAEALGLTHAEVATLASIVDEETANVAEKPMVAGLYINRLQRGILLQADPTVKYAFGDFTLRRILNVHLRTDSPYNTYIYAGLPPGPIRFPSLSALDAVLDYAHHDYIFMCAKEDFSGTHNFATTLREHTNNARRYQQALNARNIMK